MSRTNSKSLISLFSGCGGLDLGLEAAGFETAVAVEQNSDAVATLKHNRPWKVIERDIHQVPSREILEQADLNPGDADLLAGGPPCQPFSKSGYWATGDAQRLEDPRASTLLAYLRVLRDAKPKVFLLENVAGLTYKKKNEGLEFLQASVDSINRDEGTSYSFSVNLLNAASYGVPQLRERVFVIGHRDGIELEFPKPTHRLPAKSKSPPGQERLGFQDGLLDFSTAWDAIGGLAEERDEELNMTGHWADLLPSIPEGKNYLHHTSRGDGMALFGWRRRYWSFLLKLSKRLPAWTITAQPGSAIGPFHWENRRLSMKELSRLQTFPPDYEVIGSRSSIQRQIGNAVPSALAELLGLEIRAQLLQSAPRSRELSLLPQKASKTPPPEPEAPVAKKYWDRVGDHEEHPGTGKGYGAQARRAALESSAPT